MSDFARGGDNFEPNHTCIYEGCRKDQHISKAGNRLDTCKEHLGWLFDTKIDPRREQEEKELATKEEKEVEDFVRDDHKLTGNTNHIHIPIQKQPVPELIFRIASKLQGVVNLLNELKEELESNENN